MLQQKGIWMGLAWIFTFFIGMPLAVAHPRPPSSVATDSGGDDILKVGDYYTQDEGSPSVSQYKSFETPEDMLRLEAQSLWEQATSAVTLLAWAHHTQAPTEPDESYVRLKHFGTWMHDPTQGGCYNTRARALIRDSQQPVNFGSNHCTVVSGLWKDPYTGDLFDKAQQIQIDHVVPLKHAYLTGAYAWTPTKRCTYANFLANNYHLLSVSGTENMRKGDRSPDGYLPPDAQETCEYLRTWLKIKMIWKLIILPDEAQAISRLMSQNSCDGAGFQISSAELRQMQAAAEDPSHGCSNFDGTQVPQNPETINSGASSAEELPSREVARPSWFRPVGQTGS